MTSRASHAVAWGLFTVFVAISGCWIVLEAKAGEPVAATFGFSVLYAAFALVGLLIGSRRPENSLGWIFLWIALAANGGNLASSYAEHALVVDPGSLPAGAWMASVGEALWPAGIMSILLLLVLFPSGRPSMRFQVWLLRLAIVGILGVVLGGFILKPRTISIADGVEVANPMGVEVLDGLTTVLGWSGALIPVTAALAIGALIVRARRSSGVERQQFKWFGYSAIAMFSFNFVIGNLLENLFPRITDTVGNVLFVAGLAFIPVGTGIAILKYRLYDLERIVNRTLVYAVLTAALAGAYLASVVILQRLLAPVTADSDIAVAGSTLAVAALFRPLRTRVQSFIDHRFYRRKYDATETLEEFAARLRDQVDLGSLNRELIQVVGSTMQPAHATLWLRGGVPR